MSDIFTKLPRKWKFGSYTFRIKVLPTGHADLRIDDELVGDGMTHFGTFKICFDESMPLQRATVVVLHEAIHAINFVYGIEDGAQEEAIATQVSTGLIAFFVDNPKVFTWIRNAISSMKKPEITQENES